MNHLRPSWKSLLESKFHSTVGSRGLFLVEQWLQSALVGIERKGEKYYLRAKELFPFQIEGEVLDAGCGDGQISLSFALRGSRVIGVDADPEFIEIAQLRAEELSRANVQFYCTDLCEADSLADEFDLILSIDVIEHVSNAADYLRGLRKRLKPEGRVWLFTPNRFALPNIVADPHYRLAGLTLIPNSWAAVYATKWRRRVRCYEVSKLYTLHSLERLARSCGFDILFQSSSFWSEALEKRKWLKRLSDLPLAGPMLFGLYQYRIPTIEAVLSHSTLNNTASG